MSRRLICYKCFEKFPPHEVWFRCDNTPGRNPIDHCRMQKDPITGEMTTRALPLRSFGSSLSSIFKIPKRVICSECGTLSRTRICPNCHEPLPYLAGEIDAHIIAIIGEQCAGVSTYIAVLVEHFLRRDMALEFNICLEAADDMTNDLFLNEYKIPLFDDKREIAATLPVYGSDLKFIYQMSPMHRRRSTKIRQGLSKSVTLVFYDIAGEILNRREYISSAARYLWHSSGIVYLVNPLHIPELYDLLGQDGDRPPDKTPDIILQNVVAEYRKHKIFKAGGKIKVPLAVCLSQSDRLQNLDFAPIIFEFHRHRGVFDVKDFQRVDAEIREEMRNWGGTGITLLEIATLSFAKTGFFAVSSLGASPINGRVEEVNPIRVGDPFLWILSELGLIKKKGQF